MFDISYKDWCYLCNNVFYTFDPSQEDIEAEFVTGTGITSKKKELWQNASEQFADHINDLRLLKSLHINKMCRDALTEKEKYH